MVVAGKTVCLFRVAFLWNSLSHVMKLIECSENYYYNRWNVSERA